MTMNSPLSQHPHGVCRHGGPSLVGLYISFSPMIVGLEVNF